MADWAELEAAEPDFARRVRERFAAGRHHVLATLRADGSPRVSGIEVEFGAGPVLGLSPGSRKDADLLRDPRLAVHSHSPDPPADDPAGWEGDAKLAGRAVEVDPGAGLEPPGRRVTIDLAEVVLTHLDGTGENLVIESWKPGRGLRRLLRR